ncbi:hypothetical protein BD289DRAFT_11097 [Coniella lustricola]|uniref:Uncharacterized protein n=1 Tax=Coniella lustricola TaxID=2025994 RepID=A0A2T3A4G1_9PEZI|nr:hypothetical protein BD289DRAFT_11097 [Coniella lustricola]
MLILTLRPLFFLAVKSSVGGDFINAPRDMLDHPNIDPNCILQCSAAARRNLLLGHHLYKRCSLEYGGNGKLVMLDLHHIFNAVVVLLLHQMVFSNVVNTDTMAIQETRQIFEREAHIEYGSPTPTAGLSKATGYASDCVDVLNDLAALVARIRPLRFKGSDHIETGVDAVWTPPAGTEIGSISAGSADGTYSTNNLSSPILLSEEQLAANLSFENPFGLDAIYSHDMTHGPPPHPHHTNLKELERWVQEGLWGFNVPLGGYTGM